MQLRDIVPWGRSFDEYQAMFALNAADLGRSILGCGDGPASFNAEATKLGACVVSADPIYAFTGDDIRSRIAAVRHDIEAGLRAHPERYVWRRFAGVDALVATRLETMERFLRDYPGPGATPRYQAARLPGLPFSDAVFDLALVSHLLFSYSEHLDRDAHRRAAAELMRVAREVRVFPLVDLEARPSQHLQAVCAEAEAAGWQHSIVPVEYEFQRGGNRMLRLTAPD
jgi:hypothetical protein